MFEVLGTGKPPMQPLRDQLVEDLIRHSPQVDKHVDPVDVAIRKQNDFRLVTYRMINRDEH